MVHIVSTVSVFIVKRVPCSSFNCIIFITLMKVAHHGSKNSTSEELLKVLMPDYSLISCGRNNWYGHPHPELLKRLEEAGSRIMATYEKGAITLWTDGEKLIIKRFLDQ